MIHNQVVSMRDSERQRVWVICDVQGDVGKCKKNVARDWDSFAVGMIVTSRGMALQGGGQDAG